MAKSRAQKKDIVQTLTSGFKNSKLIVVSDIKGLNVSDSTKLRSVLRKQKVGHTVAKISLFKLALKRAGINPGQVQVNTQVAVSYCEDDTAAARELKKFSITNEHLKPLFGFLEGKFLSQKDVVQLALIPSRRELLGQLASVLAGPSRGLVTVLSGNLRGLAQVLSQVKK